MINRVRAPSRALIPLPAGLLAAEAHGTGSPCGCSDPPGKIVVWISDISVRFASPGNFYTRHVNHREDAAWTVSDSGRQCTGRSENRMCDLLHPAEHHTGTGSDYRIPVCMMNSCSSPHFAGTAPARELQYRCCCPPNPAAITMAGTRMSAITAPMTIFLIMVYLLHW